MNSIHLRFFHGIFSYVWISALKSRFLYAYLLSVVLGVGMVYMATQLGAQIQSPIAEEVYVGSIRSVIGYYCAILIFLSVFSASRIFPRMLDSGMVSFFFGRPYSRSAALALTTLSICLTYGIVIILCGAVLLLSYMIWTPVDISFTTLLVQLGLETLIFLIYAPILMSFAVLSRSGSYAFLGSFTVWLVAYLLAGRSGLLRFLGNDLTETIGDTLYYILPKSSEISGLFATSGASDLMPLWSSVLFALVMYVIADWKLRRIDF